MKPYAWFGIAVVLLIASNALGTAQYPDKLVFEGQEYALLTNPMEGFFKKHPEKRPKNGSTALWRGYIATFEFKDKALMLKDVQIEEMDEESLEHKSIRGEIVPKGKELAIDWFSGILVLPAGAMTRRVHMGYGSSYDGYILLEVRDGKLTGQRKLNGEQYAQFREKQFEAFKKTDDYKKLVADLSKRGGSQEFIDSFLRNFVVEYTSQFLDEPEPATRPAR